jgi:hypothetical protein
MSGHRVTAPSLVPGVSSPFAFKAIGRLAKNQIPLLDST